MKPLIKWVGGKRRFIKKYLLNEIQSFDKINNKYYEPFLGSGALFFELEPKKAVINDLNENLINFYRWVRDEPIELRTLIKDLINKNVDRESFNKIRELYNQSETLTIEKAVLFFT
jgi:DNA adenine methylase